MENLLIDLVYFDICSKKIFKGTNELTNYKQNILKFLLIGNLKKFSSFENSFIFKNWTLEYSISIINLLEVAMIIRSQFYIFSIYFILLPTNIARFLETKHLLTLKL